MAIEFDPASTTAMLNSLNASYPAGTDKKKQGDDHMRLIKRALKNTFPNLNAAVTVKPAELNALAGVSVPLAEVFSKSNNQNLFLNPSFAYNDGANPRINAPAGSYMSEQWRLTRNNTGGSFTPRIAPPVLSRFAAPGNMLEFSIATTLTGPGQIALGITQPVEDVGFLAGRKVAVSVEIDNATGPARNFSAYAVQTFGDAGMGASTSVAVGATEGNQEVPAGTVKRMTWHLDMPSIASKTIAGTEGFAETYSEFAIQCGTLEPGVFRFHSMQLEFVATDDQPASAFSMPSYGEQRAALARFFQAIEIDAIPMVAASTDTAYGQIYLAPYMRRVPTIGTLAGTTPLMTQPGIGTYSVTLNSQTASYTRITLTAYGSGFAIAYPGLLTSTTIWADARF